MKRETITPAFVEFIPSTLEEGTLYVSEKYGTAVHKCCCGCGVKIVTPLTPTDWKLTVSRGAVTMHPSIGNWNHPCQSHYFIRQNRVVWAGQMSRDEIDRGRTLDRKRKVAYFAAKQTTSMAPRSTSPTTNTSAPKAKGWWNSVMEWLRSIFL